MAEEGVSHKVFKNKIGYIKIPSFSESRFGENHHRKGYMTEAFRKVLDFSFIFINSIYSGLIYKRFLDSA